ncbi:hypothetical protein [Halobacillus sp. B29]|uniref:hypothetical protein n=1 Tax=Halobacillus sp. B29 TaxID=3457432 RepID=UPI003FCEE307
MKQSTGISTLFTYYNIQGERIAEAREDSSVKNSKLSYVLRLLGLYSIYSYHMKVVDTEGKNLLFFQRKDGFGKPFEVYDSSGSKLLTLKDKFKLKHPQVFFIDRSGYEVAELNGETFGGKMKVVGANGNVLMSINKQVALKSFKEIASTADIYKVELLSELDEDIRKSLITFPVIYDLLFFNKQ